MTTGYSAMSVISNTALWRLEGQSNMLTLDKLLGEAENIVERKKRRQRRKRGPMDFQDW